MMRSVSARAASWIGEPFSYWWERAALMTVLALAIGARIPRVWTEGRFWAEEGTVFFRKAWDWPWWEALLSPHANYLNLTGNAAALLAAHVATLRTAPYVTATIAVMIQCLPAMLLAASRDKWLQSRCVILMVCMILLFAPVAEEVWANSANSYNHLALCAALILAMEIQAGAMAKLQHVLLLLAALSGPASWSLVPLFALRAALERSMPRALQALTLMSGAIVQIVFFASLGERSIETRPSVIGAIVWAKHVVTPLLGYRLAAHPLEVLSQSFQAGSEPLWPLVLVVLLFAVAFAAAASRPDQPPLWLLVASAMLAGAGYVGAIDRKVDLISPWGGGRHAFAPQALIGLALLSWTVIHPGRLRMIGGLTLAWIVAVGAWNYFAPTSAVFMMGPVWRDEVARWRSDPDRPLQIWPPGWTIELSKK